MCVYIYIYIYIYMYVYIYICIYTCKCLHGQLATGGGLGDAEDLPVGAGEEQLAHLC